jgi:hypothetical protein
MHHRMWEARRDLDPNISCLCPPRAAPAELDGGSAAAGRPEQQADQEQNQRDEEHDFRDLRGGKRDAAEPEHRGDECDDQECD